MRTAIVIALVIVIVMVTIGLCSPRSHKISPNVYTVRGRYLVIKWDADKSETMWAIDKWFEMKNK